MSTFSINLSLVQQQNLQNWLTILKLQISHLMHGQLNYQQQPQKLFPKNMFLAFKFKCLKFYIIQ